MLSWEQDVEAHALRQQGWSISAIARHLGADRKTVRAYLNGDRVPGVRAAAGPDRFASFVEYCRLRLADDPHLWASTLFDEVRGLGYDGGYSTFTRALRRHQLRPATGADLLWRVRKDIVLAVVEQLPDGSYISEIFDQRDIHHTRTGVRVRVVEYTIAGHEGVYRLITTVLDPANAPAAELARLYAQR